MDALSVVEVLVIVKVPLASPLQLTGFAAAEDVIL